MTSMSRDLTYNSQENTEQRLKDTTSQVLPLSKQKKSANLLVRELQAIVVEVLNHNENGQAHGERRQWARTATLGFDALRKKNSVTRNLEHINAPTSLV